MELYRKIFILIQRKHWFVVVRVVVIHLYESVVELVTEIKQVEVRDSVVVLIHD